MFALLFPDDANIFACVFDNLDSNKQYYIMQKDKRELRLRNGVVRVVEIFTDPENSWMLGKDDIYSNKPGVDGWDIATNPFTSPMGDSVQLGISEEDNLNYYLTINSHPPYLDVKDEKGLSILQKAPDSELAKWVKNCIINEV